MSHQGSRRLSGGAGRTAIVWAGTARFVSGESLFLYNIRLLLIIESSILEVRSASAVSAKRHTKAMVALKLDNILGREIVRHNGEPLDEGGS